MTNGNGNGAAADMELPDAGMTTAELKAMPDMKLRHRLTQAAVKARRFDFRLGILPKGASGEQPSGGQPSGGQPGTANGFGLGGNGGGTSGGNGGAVGTGAGSGPGAGAIQREIRYAPSLRLPATRQCGAALAEHAPRLFRRGKSLAVLSLPDASENVAREGEELAVKKDLNLRRARLADSEDLKLQVDEAGILFMTPAKGPRRSDGTQKFAPSHPPGDPLTAIIRNPELCPARVLDGIACVPRMDERGNFVAASKEDGYDPATRIFHDGVSRLALSVTTRPTIHDVRNAVNTIMEPFQHYENYLGSDKERQRRWIGQVLTMVLTAVEQPFLDRIPILVVNGNAAGVGKGELCKALAIIAYGVDGDIITAGEDETEFQKRVDSMLIEGAPVAIIDNYNNRTLQSDALASYITERRARIRRYGRKGDDFDVEGRSLIMVNGNGLVPAEDMVRRTFVVELTSNDPFPATRKFPQGVAMPSATARRGRLAILEAVFTLMRWWRQKGMTKSGKVLGSFEDWSVRVGDLVHAVSGWHPADSIADNVRLDPFRQAETAAINTITDRFGFGLPFRSADVALICEAIHHARRQMAPYTTSHKELVLSQHPALEAATAAFEGCQAAFERARAAAKKTAAGGSANAGPKLEVLEKAAGEALKRCMAETQAAMARQAEMDNDMIEALKMVTRGGGVDSKTIGDWFRAVDGRVIDGKKLVRDTTTKRTPTIMIVKA